MQTFSGPLAGGWVTLQPFTRTSSPGAVRPERQQADGDRLFTTESQGEDTRVVVRDPDPREVAFAEGEDEYLARFAGDFVATTVYGEPERNRLVVRDWRTGVVTTSAEVPESFGFIALRPDGRAAVVTDDGALYEVPPGGPARPLDTEGGSTTVAYAGDALVHDPDGQLRVIDLSGRSRAFGVPTRSLEGFATEGSQVVWIANGCLLADDVGAPAAAAPGPGPCVRGELAFDDDDQPEPIPHPQAPGRVALRRGAGSLPRHAASGHRPPGADEADQRARAVLDPRRSGALAARAPDLSRLPADAPRAPA